MSEDRLPAPIRTTCPYCGVGCGVLATVDEDGRVEVKGDPAHPSNYGRLCSKGAALGETVYLAERLLYPEIAGEQVSWEQAFSAVAGGFRDIIDKHGPDAVAFYVSGQLLTEDYYVANKLMKGYIGSANIDTNSRLCMSSAVAAHKRAFGEDCVPCSYDDLERAQCVVLVGSNTAWCHPVLYQRIEQARRKHPDFRLITIDPRHTPTSDTADLHLALKPGTDAFLFNGLLVWLAAHGESDDYFIAHHTRGMREALEAARRSAPDVTSVARQCGLEARDVEAFYRLFSRHERVVTVFSQGVNQSSSGVDKINSIINCHLFTGRIGRRGMGPFSFTGQPNAMGGREVGGLANQLAAHLELENAAHRELVQGFWQSPLIASQAGLKAVDCIEAIEQGRVRAIWIMATNPVVSMPDAERVRRALQQCELVVVSDCVRETDSVQLAHIRLPATTWGERDGTVTNSERRISRQRAFLPAPGLARHDWQIICGVARAMGYGDAFAYDRPGQIFDEYARLCALPKPVARQLDLTGLAGLTHDEYDALPPVQWPLRQRPEFLAGDAFGAVSSAARSADIEPASSGLYRDGGFGHDDGRARFIAVAPALPAAAPNAEFPLLLNTGRIRDQWHTMTRTGMSPRLSAHRIEPFVDIHPQDAKRYRVEDGHLAEVRSPAGQGIFVRVRISQRQQPGSIFVPMHWNGQFSARARVDTLVPAVCDPISGQPEFKHAIAAISPCEANWYGFIISRRRPALKYARYWARSRGRGFWRYEVAGQASPDDWSAHARQLLQVSEETHWIEFHDRSDGHYRAAQIVGERLESVIFIDSQVLLPPRDWLVSLFQKPAISAAERNSLLSGMPPAGVDDAGRIVCACFNVGEKTIRAAICNKGADTVEAVGALCQAGTNCGSCKPEIGSLLKSCVQVR